MAEDQKERRDRELIELLNELRVVLPGVQMLFAFLLTVPFTQRFTSITPAQRNAYFTAFICAAVATVFLIAPSTHHRILWRAGDKEHMLRASNRMTLVGTAFLACAMCAVVFVITDVLFGRGSALVATLGAVGLFAGLWYAMPLRRRLRE